MNIVKKSWNVFQGYSSGPPSSMCKRMTPPTRQHGSPQTSPSPYYISIDQVIDTGMLLD